MKHFVLLFTEVNVLHFHLYNQFRDIVCFKSGFGLLNSFFVEFLAFFGLFGLFWPFWHFWHFLAYFWHIFGIFWHFWGIFGIFWAWQLFGLLFKILGDFFSNYLVTLLLLHCLYAENQKANI
jgi:hypothetical protein